MKGRTTLAVVLALMFQWHADAAQHSGQPTGRPSEQCLTDEAKDIIKQLKSLNRPTTKDDPIPPFDPDYFVGTWVMEWEQPESPFGNGGMLAGTLTIRPVVGCYYEGDLAAKGPDGTYKAKVQINHDPANRSWSGSSTTVVDSR